MGSLVVIHGTGVRGAAYDATFRVVERKLCLARQSVVAVRCPWGDEHGVRLPPSPLSIPRDSDRGDGLTSDDLTLDFWAQLYEDPLVELRELANCRGGGDWEAAELLRTFRTAEPNPELTEALQQLSLNVAWAEARSEITESDPLKQATERAPESTLALRQALARAITAWMTARALANGAPVPDAELREALIREMVVIFRPANEGDLGDALNSRGIADIKKGVKSSVSYGLQWLLAGFAERKRLAEAAQIAPVAGDIVLYQSPQGDAIRSFITKTISNSPKPCYVLAHSLGSVAAVDALIQNKNLGVAHLITIGSPAPLFFEMNALVSLPRNGVLPDHFSKWLNIFDPRDLISYVASRAFNNDPRIQDRAHESGQPLLAAHSAYWASDRAWNLITNVLPAI